MNRFQPSFCWAAVYFLLRLVKPLSFKHTRSTLSSSERPCENQDGERHPGRRQPPVCSQTALWWVSLKFYCTAPPAWNINWFHYCLIALNSRNFPQSFPDIPVNHIWLKLVCTCSIPDWREVVLDPWLSQRRRSFHQTLQRGEDCCVSPAKAQTDVHLIFPALVMSFFLTVCLSLSLCLAVLSSPPRWCLRRRMSSFTSQSWH